MLTVAAPTEAITAPAETIATPPTALHIVLVIADHLISLESLVDDLAFLVVREGCHLHEGDHAEQAQREPHVARQHIQNTMQNLQSASKTVVLYLKKRKITYIVRWIYIL